MAQVITLAGERLFALKAQNNEQLDIDTFVFANVPNLDPNATIDRSAGLPPAEQQVHTQIVQQVGRVNENVVIYSTVLNSDTGPFDFNYVGLYSSVNQTLVAVSYIPKVTKTVTVPGAAGNTLNRNFGIEYSGIADLTGITVSPETWQLDYTSRLNGMDELTRQLAADMNGKDWFIGDGFKVVPRTTAGSFKITAGAGYISGLRAQLDADHILTLSSYPQFVYVDAWFDGNNQTIWKAQTAFTVSNTEKSDYVDANGKQHYVFKLARITAADAVEDLRNGVGIAEKLEQHKASGDHDGVYARKVLFINDLRYFEPSVNNQTISLLGHTITGVGGGQFYYDSSDTNSDDNNGTVVVTAGGKRWKRVWVNELDSSMFGLTQASDPVAARVALTRMYAACINKAVTVSTPDFDFDCDASVPIIVGADTTTNWGRGTLHPTFTLPHQPSSSALVSGKTFKAYGGVFCSGDLATGYRYSEDFHPYMGTITFNNPKIKNIHKLSIVMGYSLHGIVCWGGINYFNGHDIQDMPSSGIYTHLMRETHAKNGRCIGNGKLGEAGTSRNGISISSTWSLPNVTWPPEDVTRVFTCKGGEYKDNQDEGIKYANVPLVIIDGNDCRFNLDRGIEGDNGEIHTQRYRENDQIYILNNDCRGIKGISKYGITCNDGWNKDVFLGGNKTGDCIIQPLAVTCRDEGSIKFLSPNTIYASDHANVTNQAHGMWLQAGIIDMLCGFEIKGAADVSAKGTLSAVVINGTITTGANVSIGKIISDSIYTNVITGKIKDKFSSVKSNCDVSKAPFVLTMTKADADIEIESFTAKMNSEASTDQGLVRIIDSVTYPIQNLRLRGNIPKLAGATRYPVIFVGGGEDNVAEMYSNQNYWHTFTFPFGVRVTSDAGNATLKSIADMPILA